LSEPADLTTWSGESAPETVDVVLLAGGRISGFFARAAGTRIKALVPVDGEPVVRRVARALAATERIGRVVAVGPDEVRDALGDLCLWQAETGSAPGNLRAGLERLTGAARVLVCASDVAVLDPGALADFLRRAPAEADVCLPAVRKEAFVRTFPGDLGIYVRLADGAFTAGSECLIRPDVFARNEELFRRLFDRRKDQLAMAATLGRRLVWRLVTGRLTVAELETRLSELTGCRCRAVLDCRPELAFDLDSVLDLRYIKGWLERQPGSPAENGHR